MAGSGEDRIKGGVGGGVPRLGGVTELLLGPRPGPGYPVRVRQASLSPPARHASLVGSLVDLLEAACLRRGLRLGLGLGLGLWGVGCAPGIDESRRGDVHFALTDDARDLALRSPREVAARFARMADDPFSFVRGSVQLWARDLAQPGTASGARRSCCADGVAGAILLIGDPHPENVGTAIADDDVLVVGFNDYDVARLGPAVYDLRRLAWAFVAATLPDGPLGHIVGDDFGDDFDDDVAGVVVDGYREGLLEALPRLDQRSAARATMGRVVDGLFRDALADRQKTPPADAVLDSIPDDAPLEAELLVVPPADLLVPVDAALRAVGLPPTQVAQAIGRGVGSRPLLRFRITLEDGRTLQLKESRDSFPIPHLVAPGPRVFVDNAERVVAARRALWGDNGADDVLQAVSLAPLGGVLTREEAGLRTVRLRGLADDVVEGRLGVDDLLAYARACGRMLAHHHRRGLRLIDVDEAAFVDAVLAGDVSGDVLRLETVAAVAAMATLAGDDYHHLQALLEQHGPLLGLDEGTP